MRRRARARLLERRTRRVPIGRMGVAASAGAVALGLPGAVAGAVLGALWDHIGAARARRAGDRMLDEQLPEVLRSIAAAVRAGRSIPQALEAAHEEAVEPVRGALAAAMGRLEVGAPLDEAMEAFTARAGTELAEVAAETVRVARSAGGNVARVLEVAVASSNERLRIARDRRAATSQARMSAAVVGGMPLAFYALLGSGARARLLELLTEPAGWVVVGGGLALEAAGVLWMRAAGS